MRRRIRQIRHMRTSKKGKKFVAGSKKAKDIPNNVKKEIIKEYFADTKKDLKKSGRVKLPELGFLKIRIKKATKARPGRNPFTGENIMIKAKPAKKVVKFKAAKELEAML